MRTDRVAYWGALGAALLAVGGGFLIAASQTTCGGWATFFVVSGIGAIVISAYIFAALGLDRGLPAVGHERTQQKVQREIDAIQAAGARRDAFQALFGELDRNRRDAENELAHGRVWGAGYEIGVWGSTSLLSEPELLNSARLLKRRTA